MKKVVKPLRTVYAQNDLTTVTVINKPVYADEALLGYEPTIQIAVKAPYNAGKPFEFTDDDDIAEFIGQIDVEDPQQGLGI